MGARKEEPKPVPSRLFNVFFVFALLFCIFFVIIGILYSPYEFCGKCFFEYRGIAAQIIGPVVFTLLTLVILHSRTSAKKLDLNGAGLLAAVERMVLEEQTWLAQVLIWSAGIALFFMMAEPRDAAIFLMAVIAIYVAFEHLSELGEQRELVVDQSALLGEQEKMLEKYAQRLDSLANAVGLESGRREIYTAYKSENEKIMAIVHFFEIDIQWFRAEDEVRDYKKQSPAATFYDSLKNVPEVLFVADLPLPLRKLGPYPIDEAQLSNQFNNLLGLAWQWRMLDDMVKDNQSETKRKFQIKIASTSNWIHVTNKRVYQILPGKVSRGTRVRDLTIDLADDDAQLVSLRAWAQEEIYQAAERGSDGQEFLCAAIFSRFLSGEPPDYAVLTRSGLGDILRDLGMEEWIGKHADYVEGLVMSREDLTERCLDIFQKFLIAVTHEGQQTSSLSEGLRKRLEANRPKPPEAYICQALFVGREVM